MLIENVLGLEVNGADDQVVWRVSRTDRHGIENLSFGDIRASLICMPRNSANTPGEIEVETNQPFTLILERAGQSKRFEITNQKKTIQF